MQIKDSKILILGGYGLVGTAICHALMKHKPATIFIASLKREEAEEACKLMQAEYPKVNPKSFIPK